MTGTLPTSGLNGVLLGWPAAENPGFGFTKRPDPDTAASCDLGEPVIHDGEDHVLTVASTGKGKSRNAIIPNALTYNGTLIIFDPKGEIYRVTHRRRRAMGQPVYVLDPFHWVTDVSDRLDPLDLFELPGAMVDCDAEMLAAQLSIGHTFTTDPYWTDTSRSLIAGLIGLIASTVERKDRTMASVRKQFYCDDFDYWVASQLDSLKDKMVPMAYESLASYLQIPSDKTRPCVKSTAETFLTCLGSEAVCETLKDSTIPLGDLLANKPMTIYIVMPPDKIESHIAVLRLWLSTLLTTIGRRPEIPTTRTLMIIDEAAQIGPLPMLKTAITLMRGSGLTVWTLWQSLGQIKMNFPADWQTILANSGVWQTFGVSHPFLAREWADVLDIPPQDIYGLNADEQLLFLPRLGRVERFRKVDYLVDGSFAGMFEENPRYRLFRKPGLADDSTAR